MTQRVVASASFADDEAGRRALRDWAQRNRDGQVRLCWLPDPRTRQRGSRSRVNNSPGSQSKYLHSASIASSVAL